MTPSSQRATFYIAAREHHPAILYKLLLKIIDANPPHRVVVLCAHQEQDHDLTAQLWTLGRNTFLPHGNHEDGMPNYQPIWLTSSQETSRHPPNAKEHTPHVLVTYGDALPTTQDSQATFFQAHRHAYERFVLLIDHKNDGTDEAYLAQCQNAWGQQDTMKAYRHTGKAWHHIPITDKMTDKEHHATEQGDRP
ncbi:MAG: DNA polymerase III subunit chi [Alphaproteobacteria bacterium GM7ARS4]|nr:DNA polymerase III subunit chi [Alphaproteobacteria bacterium GM7ARS4]